MKYLLPFILFTVLSVSLLYAHDDIPDPMDPPRMVNDFAGVFDEEQQNDLERILQAYHDTTSTQIYVVTVNSLGYHALYSYATNLGNKWGIGQKGKDNGVLILIKPKTSEEKGEVFISTGYGIEPYINDAYAGRIIDRYMIPHLKENNDYYTAVKSAVDVIIARLSGNFTYDRQEEKEIREGMVIMLILGFIFCILPFGIFLWLSYRFARKNPHLAHSNRKYSENTTYDSTPPPTEPPKKEFKGGGGGRFGGGGAGRSW